MRERFKQEARIAAHVESEHIVDVFDAGVDEPTGMPFLVMELLQGEELSKRLKRLRRLPPAEVVAFLHQTALALDRTHAKLHRPPAICKPDNPLLDPSARTGSPRIKILDFGIAKIVAESATGGATRSLGTPLYMAPEQYRAGSKLTAAADIYALGMMATTPCSWESRTGESGICAAPATSSPSRSWPSRARRSRRRSARRRAARRCRRPSARVVRPGDGGGPDPAASPGPRRPCRRSPRRWVPASRPRARRARGDRGSRRDGGLHAPRTPPRRTPTRPPSGPTEDVSAHAVEEAATRPTTPVKTGNTTAAASLTVAPRRRSFVPAVAGAVAVGVALGDRALVPPAIECGGPVAGVDRARDRSLPAGRGPEAPPPPWWCPRRRRR